MFWNKDLELKAQTLKEHYSAIWSLKPDGEAFYTLACLLQPVIYKNKKAMLKISMEEEEQYGGLLMKWWNGKGAALVYEYEREALLMERIEGNRSLKQMAENNQDDDATIIICEIAQKLHGPYHKPLPPLIDLNDWFYELLHAHEKYGDRFEKSALIAGEVLNTTKEKVVLHGDLHHENILHSTKRGWLAIDPKRLFGNPAFEYANIFCNPTPETALIPGRLQQQLKIVSAQTGFSRKIILQWIIAYTALSGIWMLSVDEDATATFAINEIALKELYL